MSHIYTSPKSPLIAGILSIVPGLGQIYNEQTGKGLLMFLLFIGTFLFFVLRLTPFSFLPNMPPLEGIGHYSPNPVQTVWITSWGMSKVSRIYPILWFMVLLPFFVVFSIADAVQNARRINLGFSSAGASPSPFPSPPPPLSGGKASHPGEQERLRNEAQQKMEQTATGFGTGVFSSPQEESMTAQNQTQIPPEEPVRKKSRGISGKFLLGVILMAIGGIYILDEWEIHVFEWVSWDRLWPLIPLFFGLRLLGEYQRDRDRGQIILGIGFTLVGSIFFLENWGIFPARDFLENFWMFLLFGIGALFICIDLLERRRQ